MSTQGYEVYVNTDYVPTDSDDQHFYRYSSVEIMPPISRELAGLVCSDIFARLDEDANGWPDEDQRPFTLSTYGHCDEGATVSTLIRFINQTEANNVAPTFEATSREDARNWTDVLKRVIEKTLSPSGAAIAKTKEYSYR